jgi:hypothetical protein
MKKRFKSNLKVTTGVTFNKQIIIGVSFAIFIAIGVYIYLNVGNVENAKAATTHKSKMEKRGNWETATSWTSNVVPANGDNYEIEGTITRNGNLTIGNNQTLKIKAGDTLIIAGDLTLSNQAVLTIEDDAALVVRGDYTTHQQTNDQVQGGVLIVLGRFTFNGGGADILAAAGSKIYYDQTLNSPTYIDSRVSGAGELISINSLPNTLFEAVYGTPMPVTISDFSLTGQEDKIAVSWKSLQETEIKEYEVQKSTDGVSFRTIGSVEALGNETIDYAFEDKNPSKGVAYYRLAIVSYEDESEYSDVTHINYTGKIGELVVFPSVITGTDINFKGGDINNKNVKILVYDLSGKSVLAENINTSSEEVQTINFPKKLNRGNYYIQFVYDNLVKKEKFMVGE